MTVDSLLLQGNYQGVSQPAGPICGHAAAAGGIALTAYDASSQNTVESFSCAGPTKIYHFDSNWQYSSIETRSTLVRRSPQPHRRIGLYSATKLLKTTGYSAKTVPRQAR